MNFTLGHVQCLTMGYLVHAKLYATNENMRKTKSTVYPIQSTLFYIVKIYCEQMRHMCANPKHD